MLMNYDDFLSSCQLKAKEALNVRRIQTWLGVAIVFELTSASDFFNLLLVRFHQAEIIIRKYLIQGRNNETWVGVNH